MSGSTGAQQKKSARKTLSISAAVHRALALHAKKHGRGVGTQAERAILAGLAAEKSEKSAVDARS